MSIVASTELEKAMEFFRWKVMPLVILPKSSDQVKKLKGLPKVVPFGHPLDLVSEGLLKEAMKAYEHMLAAEKCGEAEVIAFWNHLYWRETHNVESFRSRTNGSIGAGVKMVIWADKGADRDRFELIDAIDDIDPGLLI